MLQTLFRTLPPQEAAMGANGTDTKTDEMIFLGTRMRIVADAETTGGGFSVVDHLEVPAGEMPPLHVHHLSDECFYVLSGEVTFYTPGNERTLRAGDFLLAPRGIPHTYRVGDEPAHWLVISQPAGFERFAAAVAELGAPDPETLARVAAEHDIEILGPPGTLP
jgi:quercetin dioxygenase-like cupin family protein